MSNQQAIDEALDKLEIDNVEQVAEEVTEVVEEVIEDTHDEPTGEPEANENPPGYIDNLDDWVAAGKDPDLFKGKKAYSAEYERIQEIKDLKGLVKTVVDTTSEWKSQQEQAMASQLDQAKADAIAELERAKEDVDIDAALKAQKKINEFDKPTQEVYQPNPVLTDFYSKNPILDKGNSQFDAEVFQDASQFQAVIINELTGGNPKMELTPSQIERSLKVALAKAKALSPDKFVSPRNTRKAAPAQLRSKVQQKGNDYTSRLKMVKSNTKNKRDTDAANDIYEMLKAKDPKAAETFAKNVLGE